MLAKIGWLAAPIRGCWEQFAEHDAIMKRLLFKFGLLTLMAFAYIASPFVTAWSIREAARSGNAAYLERAIDWPSVRQTLKPAVSRLALNLPDPDQAPLTKPGLWQRFKTYVGQTAIDTAVDSYVTPEGLPRLFAMRKVYRDNISREPDEALLYTISERIQRAWARVKRAEFTSLTSFEMDMADKHDPHRVYLGKLEFTGLGWTLKELRVKFLETAEDKVVKFAQTSGAGFIPPAEAAEAGNSLER
jgi:Protein of unknown function (DUF2939)